MAARIAAISTSSGGVPKHPIADGEASIGSLGIEGDAQANTKIHGGPDKALCLWSLEEIEALQREGHPIDVGNTGENLTIAGIDWETLTPGTRLRLGRDVEIEISEFCTPCSKNAQWFTGENFMRISHQKRDGVSRLYARVTNTGRVRLEDPVEVL